jgi:ABC-type branched-subunit amino acid transport system permease subunit
MFFILTMLVLAQFWNLLAGYGGLVSVGQQAFVGIGAYAMFGVVILMGSRSDPGDPDGRVWRPCCSPSRPRSSPSACRVPISPSAPG